MELPVIAIVGIWVWATAGVVDLINGIFVNNRNNRIFIEENTRLRRDNDKLKAQLSATIEINKLWADNARKEPRPL